MASVQLILNVVASSKGGSGYAPTQQGYSVNMVPGQQTAVLVAASVQISLER